jgi:transposase InsO family protein
MIYENIQQKPSELSLQKACKVLGVCRASYLNWLSRPPSPASEGDKKLLKKIQEVSEKFPYYGYRRVAVAVSNPPVFINRKKVLKIMREHHFTVKKRAFKPKTTQSKKGDPRFPNLALNLVLTHVNQVWDTDITYVSFEGGFLYLAMLTDRFSKKCVGWELSRKCDAQLCSDALQRAFETREGVCLKGLIHHGDHGSQYTSAAYTALLNDQSIKPSMGETGNCYENPFAESMNKTVKYDYIHRSDWHTFEEAYEGIQEYIEEYNARRIHSSIGYKTPDEFETGLRKD